MGTGSAGINSTVHTSQQQWETTKIDERIRRRRKLAAIVNTTFVVVLALFLLTHPSYHYVLLFLPFFPSIFIDELPKLAIASGAGIALSALIYLVRRQKDSDVLFIVGWVVFVTIGLFEITIVLGGILLMHVFLYDGYINLASWLACWSSFAAYTLAFRKFFPELYEADFRQIVDFVVQGTKQVSAWLKTVFSTAFKAIFKAMHKR